MLQTYGLSVAYEGKNFKHDKECLYALTPALFAFASVIKDVADVIEPNSQPLTIAIVTGSNFGFLYRLESQDQYTFNNLSAKLRSKPIKHAIDFKKLFKTLVDIFDFIKVINNRKINGYQFQPEEKVQISFNDGDSVTISDAVYRAYSKPDIRHDIDATLEPLHSLNADSFEFYTETNQHVRMV